MQRQDGDFFWAAPYENQTYSSQSDDANQGSRPQDLNSEVTYESQSMNHQESQWAYVNTTPMQEVSYSNWQPQTAYSLNYQGYGAAPQEFPSAYGDNQRISQGQFPPQSSDHGYYSPLVVESNETNVEQNFNTIENPLSHRQQYTGSSRDNTHSSQIELEQGMSEHRGRAKGKGKQEPLPFEQHTYTLDVRSGPATSSKTKHRRKLTDDQKRLFKDIRKKGSCYECKFRKQACDGDEPCHHCRQLCIRENRPAAVADIICQRKNPFTTASENIEYYSHSDSTRITDFGILVGPSEHSEDATIYVNDESSCQINLPIQLYQYEISHLDRAQRSSVLKAISAKCQTESFSGKVALVVKGDFTSPEDIGQWALNYVTEYCRLHEVATKTNRNPFQGRSNRTLAPNTWVRSFVFGSFYASAGLCTEGRDLIVSCLQVMALDYILRAGMRCYLSAIHDDTTLATAEATIETLLYRSICAAETKLIKQLSTLIWTAYGRIEDRMQIPVSFALWQVLQLKCFRVCHLTNLVEGPQDYSVVRNREAEHLTQNFNLMLSLHVALYRSSCPLLSNFLSRTGGDLFNGNIEVAEAGVRLREALTEFRDNSYEAPFCATAWYRVDFVEQLRNVFYGEGLSFN
ncbi:hypothetical protein B0O99DRAFT_691527 [Bisporella sp. PMI_857]|nr:hypothetical protein B0O99DRAFT_691527 [Bisporella sp. PMI_857]